MEGLPEPSTPNTNTVSPEQGHPTQGSSWLHNPPKILQQGQRRYSGNIHQSRGGHW